MFRFLAALLIVSFLSIVAVRLAGFGWPSFFFESLILLGVSTAGLYLYLIKVRNRSPEFFVQLYLLTIALKLLAFGSYMGIVVWMDRDGAVQNVVSFLAMYMVFTAMEVVFLWTRVAR